MFDDNTRTLVRERKRKREIKRKEKKTRKIRKKVVAVMVNPNMVDLQWYDLWIKITENVKKKKERKPGKQLVDNNKKIGITVKKGPPPYTAYKKQRN